MTKERLDYLDGLKGLLAIGVVSYHYYGFLLGKDASLVPFPVVALFTKGALAVDFFFILSGFLMARQYYGRADNVPFGTFLFKKLRRILPCFLTANILFAILALADRCLIHSRTMPELNVWKFFMTCMPFNYGWVSTEYLYGNAGWFISVLFLCYILYFAFLKIGKRSQSAYLFVCIFMIFAGWSFHTMDLKIPFLYRETARGYMGFFIGVMLNFVFRLSFNKQLLSKIGLALTGMIFLLAHFYSFDRVLGNYGYCFDFILFPFLLLAITTMPLLQKGLSAKIPLALGRRSMSIYLIHLPVINGIKIFDFIVGGGERKLDPSLPMTYIVVWVVVLIAASLEYELLEKRIFPQYIPKWVALLKKGNFG